MAPPLKATPTKPQPTFPKGISTFCLFRIPLVPGPLLSSPLKLSPGVFYFCFRAQPGALVVPASWRPLLSPPGPPFLCFCASDSQHPGAQGPASCLLACLLSFLPTQGPRGGGGPPLHPSPLPRSPRQVPEGCVHSFSRGEQAAPRHQPPPHPLFALLSFIFETCI